MLALTLPLTAPLRRTAQVLTLLISGLLVALLLGAVAGPRAFAQEASPSPSPSPAPEPVTVTLHEAGPDPLQVTIAPGGSVLFVNDDTGAHGVNAAAAEDDSREWSFQATLRGKAGEDRASAQTPAFAEPGLYRYDDRTILGAPIRGTIEVKVPEPAPSESASPDPSADPSASPSASASPGGAAPGSSGSPSPGASSPAPAGGSGTTGPLPLTGGFGSLGTTPVPVPGDPLAPAIAPPLVLGEEPAPPLPYVASSPEPESAVAALPLGSLPGVPTGREYGLPALLAALAIVGLTSLIVRVLLAEPAARREPEAARGVRPVLVTG